MKKYTSEGNRRATVILMIILFLILGVGVLSQSGSGTIPQDSIELVAEPEAPMVEPEFETVTGDALTPEVVLTEASPDSDADSPTGIIVPGQNNESDFDSTGNPASLLTDSSSVNNDDSQAMLETDSSDNVTQLQETENTVDTTNSFSGLEESNQTEAINEDNIASEDGIINDDEVISDDNSSGEINDLIEIIEPESLDSTVYNFGNSEQHNLTRNVSEDDFKDTFITKNNSWEIAEDGSGLSPSQAGEGLLFVTNPYLDYYIKTVASLGESPVSSDGLPRNDGGYGILFETALDNDLNDSGFILQFDRGFGRGEIIIRNREIKPNSNDIPKTYENSPVYRYRDLPDKNDNPGWWAAEHQIEMRVTGLANSDDLKQNRNLSVYLDNKHLFDWTFKSEIKETQNNYTGFRVWHDGTGVDFVSLEIGKLPQEPESPDPSNTSSDNSSQDEKPFVNDSTSPDLSEQQSEQNSESVLKHGDDLDNSRKEGLAEDKGNNTEDGEKEAQEIVGGKSIQKAEVAQGDNQDKSREESFSEDNGNNREDKDNKVKEIADVKLTREPEVAAIKSGKNDNKTEKDGEQTEKPAGSEVLKPDQEKSEL